MRNRRLASATLAILLFTSCAAVPLHPGGAPIHPGAVNRLDSDTYDGLQFAQGIIEHAQAESIAGTLPANLKAPLNVLVDSYNVARASWLTYRAAVKASTAADVAGLKSRIDAMAAALNAFNQKRSIP